MELTNLPSLNNLYLSRNFPLGSTDQVTLVLVVIGYPGSLVNASLFQSFLVCAYQSCWLFQDQGQIKSPISCLRNSDDNIQGLVYVTSLLLYLETGNGENTHVVYFKSVSSQYFSLLFLKSVHPEFVGLWSLWKVASVTVAFAAFYCILGEGGVCTTYYHLREFKGIDPWCISH